MPAMLLHLQGTMSHVGKSFLAAGFCRLFAKMGYRVSPFKAQNLAGKSHVLPNGEEIGVGQAVQARAAGICPTSEMNPFLLKVMPDGAFSAFLHGRKLTKEEGAFYRSHREMLMEELLRDFRKLEAVYDIVVIEGAGSPAEPNLMDRDIANMGFSRLVGAPVLLVGDCERGGVFASLYGTVELLPESDRQRIKGFILNQFSGALSLLEPAPSILEAKTGIPVLGVLPRLSVCLEEEDLSFGEPPTGSFGEEETFEQIAKVIETNLPVDRILSMMKDRET